MHPSRSSLLSIAAVLVLGLTGTALLADPRGWGGGEWDDEPPVRADAPRGSSALEGQITLARFRADGSVLGQGGIAVQAMPGDPAPADPRLSATFEAAVEDQLLHAGYAAAARSAGDGQIAEVRVLRSEAQPAEAPHKPLSGSVTMGVSNRGSMMGMALQYDATKPRKALIATRLEARIRDRVSGAVLWEGRAEIYTRAGDERWDDQSIATRLARALFDGFPTRLGEEQVKR